MKNLFPLAQHYEEALPSENAAVKESEARLQATYERLAKMKFEALKKGILLTCTTKAHLKESQVHFEEKELPKHPEAPKLKMRDLLLNSLIARMLKNGKKDPS